MRSRHGILEKHHAFDAAGTQSLNEEDGITLEVVKTSKRLQAETPVMF
jgi:hypothetical protein